MDRPDDRNVHDGAMVMKPYLEAREATQTGDTWPGRSATYFYDVEDSFQPLLMSRLARTAKK